MNQQQYVILDLKNGFKCEGNLVTIDKVNFKVVLSNAKKYITEEDGTLKEENFPNLEVPKDEIKEVKLVQYDNEPTKTNINAIPENKQNPQLSIAKPKTYNKSESFFDSLIPMNNRDARNETMRYNDKNMETFNLTEEAMYSSGVNRGRGYRGRGNYRGDNRGGNNFNRYNNYNKNYNNNYNNNYNSYSNYDNNNANYNTNYNSNYDNNYNNNYNNYRNNRGGYQKNNYGGSNTRGRYFNNRVGFGNKNINNNFDNLNEDNAIYSNNLNQQHGNTQGERSIYDDKL
jgi:hypothetical protein